MHPLLKRESFRIGFSAALGVAVLAALLFAIAHVAMAALAVGTPFVASFVVAILLEPLVNRVQRNVRILKKNRMPAVIVVYLLFLLAFVALLTYFVPNIIDQAKHLVGQFPTYVSKFRELINHFLEAHHKIGPITLPQNVDALANKYSDQFYAKIQAYAGDSVQIVIGSISGLLTVVLVPIITFFVLSDMPRLRARFLFLLPDRFRPGFQHLVSDVGGVFGNYIRGMLIVCSMYGVVAAGVFFLFHMAIYAILLGFAAGVLYAIPYVGALSLSVLSGIVSLSIGNSMELTLLLLASIFLLNMVFDNVLVPRVVGDSVGLHPLLTIFALFLGGELFGIWGMLLSVPVAASIQVVLFRLYPKLCEATPMVMTRSFMSPETDSITRDEDEADSAVTHTGDMPPPDRMDSPSEASSEATEKPDERSYEME